jgi:AmmeMemoRadiSam system protein A
MRCSEPSGGGIPEAALGADEQLLALARASVAHGLRHGTPLAVDPGALAPPLRQALACFVTLRRDGELRGCVGNLEACSPLAVAAAQNAFRAAFKDTRFAPLREEELSDLEVHVSVLSPPEPLPVGSEEELLRALRPRVDGLVLRTDTGAGTFLPAVWDQLPEASSFVRALKRKIGLPEDAWAPSWCCERFTAREVG